MKGKIKSRLWLIMWFFILISGFFFFYSAIKDATGWSGFLCEIIGYVFPFVWVGTLYIIERKCFNGLYEKWKNEK